MVAVKTFLCFTLMAVANEPLELTMAYFVSLDHKPSALFMIRFCKPTITLGTV